MYSKYKMRRQSAIIFILKGLIPYSRENMMLAFKPNQFFNELEKISRYKRQTLENALREAQKRKLIDRQAKVIKLTEQGKSLVRPYIAEHLPGNAKLMVIFDIPEEMAVVRAHFRRILRSWQFDQVQQSVLITSYDHRRSVKEVIAELGIDKYVELYECAAI